MSLSWIGEALNKTIPAMCVDSHIPEGVCRGVIRTMAQCIEPEPFP
jgi:hypothetical protein